MTVLPLLARRHRIRQNPRINRSDVAGRSPDEIHDAATGAGLIPKGPDPKSGKGSYIDPVTGKQRILIHPDSTGGHVHVNNPAGERLGIGGEVVDPESPAAHLPLAP